MAVFFVVFCVVFPGFALKLILILIHRVRVRAARLNSESWPRARDPGRESRKTDCTETSILAPWIVR